MPVIQSLFRSACILFLVTVQPAVASPRSDADYIAARFVEDDAYRVQMHEMVTKARVGEVRRTLSAHSVKVRDQKKFTELLSHFNIPEVVFDRIQRVVADRLVGRIGPKELESLAEYVKNQPQDPKVRRRNAEAAGTKRAMTAEEFKQLPDEIAGLAEDPAFKNEMVAMSVGIMAIVLAVQAAQTINTAPKPSEIADLLEVDGVFQFPNQIARRNLIRDLRAAKP